MPPHNALGTEAQSKLLLEHDYGAPEQRTVRQQLEHNARRDLHAMKRPLVGVQWVSSAQAWRASGTAGVCGDVEM